MSFQTIEVEYSANCFDDNDDPIPAAEDGYDADNDYMCCLCNPRYERGECSYCKYRFTEFCKGSSMIISLSTQTLEAGCCQFVNKGLAPASHVFVFVLTLEVGTGKMFQYVDTACMI